MSQTPNPKTPQLAIEERSKIRQVGLAALSAGALALAAGCASTATPAKPPAPSEVKQQESQAKGTPNEDVIVLQVFGIVCDTPPPKKK